MFLKELDERGFIKFSSNVDQSILDVSKTLGDVYKVPTMPLVQTLMPRLKDNKLSNTYSGIFGVEEFPFHTDLAHWFVPPRYILLRCVSPVLDVYTKLIDSTELYSKNECGLLSRAHFKSRKKLDRTSNILRLKQGKIFRWDSIFIKPINESANDIYELIRLRIDNAEYQNIALKKKGDCLLIDNWRMLHGRSAVGSESMQRKLERVYFEEVMY